MIYDAKFIYNHEYCSQRIQSHLSGDQFNLSGNCAKPWTFPRAFDIYYAICQLGDGCRQKDIADHTFLSKQTINSTIHQMEKDGLITLRPGKGRSRNIYLTPLGQDIIYAKIRPVIDCENRSFDTMTPADAEVLLQSSNTYISHLRAAFSDLLGKDTKQ